MRKLQKILTNIFDIFVSISVLGGIIVFVAYIIGIIIGGDAGAAIMVTAWKKLFPYFIKSAALAISVGLILFYVNNQHTLSLKEEKAESIAK